MRSLVWRWGLAILIGTAWGAALPALGAGTVGAKAESISGR